MYDLADVLPDTEIDPGTNVLVAGPPLTGKRKIALDVLASGAQRGDGTIIVTTKDSADKVLSEFTGVVGDADDVSVGIVDCVTKQRGIGSVEDDPRIKYASSPVDMTGIGIKLSEFLQEFYEVRGLSQNRIMLHSVSTLLMYSNLQTVFRFLHVFTGRVQSADALGIYVIDSTAHDDQTMNTLKQLFDAIIEVEEGEGSEPKIRTAGFSS
ncbi:recombinase RecA [Halobacteria archaeon AArc-m2/3/4]|uniref:Recombinase RecA n=1 Tax=Natronoglomus mannanivorans TaxID=2979990 RepID=A0AAP3E0G8_9EURY|nr:recombinase RecA [Halobacteria archaeon AArc-xg1-1]MCU4971826.1 recombinase RecA [Halobacteria archaeon AArc-m2/3/4]